MAKSIVNYFPSMKNFSSPERPWVYSDISVDKVTITIYFLCILKQDLIYNEKNNVGVLELYIRQKRSRDRPKLSTHDDEEPLTKK